jgi:type IV pilus assembly protein PilV
LGKQSGFSLLEVSIAMAIMAVGLSGLSALLVRAVSGTALALQQITASQLADSLAAQLDVTPGANATLLSGSPAVPDCQPSASCLPQDFALYNYARWQAAVAGALPQGQGLVCRDQQAADGRPGAPDCDGRGPAVIKIFWRVPGTGGQAAARHVRSLGS